jgi:hypothetical protein
MATMPRERFQERVEERTMVPAPDGPVVRWSGIIAGLVVSAGGLLLLSVLGVAVGIAALPDGSVAGGDGAARLGTAAAIWAGLSLLAGFFVAGLVSARATNHPDRGGAVIQGTLVWVLGIAIVAGIVMSGIGTTVAGLVPGFGFLARGAIVSGVSTTTGTSSDEAARALDDLRARIAPIRDDPARVAAEVHAFFDQLAERPKPPEATAVQRPARLITWMVMGALLLTLLVSIGGALAGTPDLENWRAVYE